MTKVLIFQVRIPENKIKDFEELMNKQGFGYQSTGEFRITNLDDWLTGKQRNLS